MGFFLLIILFLGVFALLKILNGVVKVRRAIGDFHRKGVPFEACPACQQRIRIKGDTGTCSFCGVKLGRTPNGKLIRRING